MLLAGRAGERQHSDLHGEAKYDLRRSDAERIAILGGNAAKLMKIPA